MSVSQHHMAVKSIYSMSATTPYYQQHLPAQFSEYKEGDPRFALMNPCQSRSLCNLLCSHIALHKGDDACLPVIRFRLIDYICKLRQLLDEANIPVESFRINGGAASCVIYYDSLSAIQELQRTNSEDYFSGTASPLELAKEFSSQHHQCASFDKSSSGDLLNDFSDFSDIDVIILLDSDDWSEVRACAFAALRSFLACPDCSDGLEPVKRHSIARGLGMDQYINKQVKVSDFTNTWSLLAFRGYLRCPDLELKFVRTVGRSYLFSIDSFNINLNPLIDAYVPHKTTRSGSTKTSTTDNPNHSGDGSPATLTSDTMTDAGRVSSENCPVSENGKSIPTTSSYKLDGMGQSDNSPTGAIFERSEQNHTFLLGSPDQLSITHALQLYSAIEKSKPIVVECIYGHFVEAFKDMKHRVITIRDPQQIRGGGLFRYCHLLIKGFRVKDTKEMRRNELTMVVRFLADFGGADICHQIENYHSTHLRHYSADVFVDWLKCLQLVSNFDVRVNAMIGIGWRCLHYAISSALYRQECQEAKNSNIIQDRGSAQERPGSNGSIISQEDLQFYNAQLLYTEQLNYGRWRNEITFVPRFPLKMPLLYPVSGNIRRATTIPYSVHRPEHKRIAY